MNDEKFDKEIRQFLKKVGIQSNQAIESAVRDAMQRDLLKGDETLTAVMHLKVEGLELDLSIEGQIALE